MKKSQLMMPFILYIVITLVKIAVADVPYPLQNVGVDVTLGNVLNEPIILTDDYDKLINIADLMHEKPTIINFVYLNCRMLCHLTLDGLAEVAKESRYRVGNDYLIITVSIDPKESNTNLRTYKKKYMDSLDIPNGWLFLKGDSDTIQKITRFFGYNYEYIERTNDYAHPSVLFFYKNGISNYIEGVTYEPTHFDYSLMNLKDKKTLREKIITYCYYFDPSKQTYSLLIFKILRIISLITVLILFTIIGTFIYKERQR